jgi:hypothetical protein
VIDAASRLPGSDRIVERRLASVDCPIFERVGLQVEVADSVGVTQLPGEHVEEVESRLHVGELAQFASSSNVCSVSMYRQSSPSSRPA